MSLKGKCAIIGFGETEFVKSKNSEGRSNYTEQCNAAKLAINDAGLNKEDIDGLISICPLDQKSSWTMDLAEYLQLYPKFLDNLYFGGASGNAAILYAAAAINSGLCNNVLLVC